MNLRILILIAGLAGSFAAHADCSSSWAESSAAAEKARETYNREDWEAASPQLAQVMAPDRPGLHRRKRPPRRGECRNH